MLRGPSPHAVHLVHDVAPPDFPSSNVGFHLPNIGPGIIPAQAWMLQLHAGDPFCAFAAQGFGSARPSATAQMDGPEVVRDQRMRGRVQDGGVPHGARLADVVQAKVTYPLSGRRTGTTRALAQLCSCAPEPFTGRFCRWLHDVVRHDKRR